MQIGRLFEVSSDPVNTASTSGHVAVSGVETLNDATHFEGAGNSLTVQRYNDLDASTANVVLRTTAPAEAITDDYNQMLAVVLGNSARIQHYRELAQNGGFTLAA